jgi:hypothetical protein
MMNKIRLLLLLLLSSFSFRGLEAQDTNTIILESSIDIVCQSAQKAICKEKRSYKILNDKGVAHAFFAVQCSAGKTLTHFTGNVSNADGQMLKKIKLSELKRTELSDALATDYYTLYYDYTPATYPIIITYEWEESYTNGFFHLPPFCPQEGYGTEVEHATYKASLPSSVGCRYKVCHSATTVKQDSLTVQAELDHLAAIKEEPLSKDWTESVPKIYFSPKNFEYDGTTGNFTTWNDLAKWQWQLISTQQALPDDMKSKIHALTDTCTTPRSKLAVLYKFLEQSTRYVSIQLGIGGFQPMAASEVAQKGFGDCKGLTNYMHSMLAEVGVPSSYVIINTDRRALFHDYPSLEQFDHAILMVPIDKDTVWVECTAPSLPLGYVHHLIAGHECLEITPEQGRIVTVPMYQDSLQLAKSDVDMQVNADGSTAIQLSRHYYDGALEDYSHVIKSDEKEQKETLLSMVYAPQVDIDTVQWSEYKTAFARPHVDLTARLNSKRYASVTGERLFVPVCPLHKSTASLPVCSNRVSDVEIADGQTLDDVISIHLPKDYGIESLPQSVSYDYPFGNFQSKIEQGENLIKIHFRYVEHRGTYPKDNYEQMRKFRNEVLTAYRQKIVLKKM